MAADRRCDALASFSRLTSRRAGGSRWSGRLPSLKAVLHLPRRANARCLKVYRRNTVGEWRDEPDVYRDGASFELPRLLSAIAVDEVYDDIFDGAGRSLLR